MNIMTASFLVLSLSLVGCKKSESKAKSLSVEELKACGAFNGDRLLVTITPAAEFSQDQDLAVQTFAQSMATTTLSGYSYFEQSDGSISAACKLYVQTEQAKYRSFLNLDGARATRAGILSGLTGLAKEVERLRRLHAADAKADSYQIQIILAFSSHGAGDNRNPDGGILTGDRTLMPFVDLAQMIQQQLLTPCSDRACSAVDANQQRKADEVLILMDTCFSGRFNRSLQGLLSQQPGYGSGGMALNSRSKATRVLSFSAAGVDQLAPGSINGTANGSLYEGINEALRFWQGDKDNNNALSIAELRDQLIQGIQISNLASAVAEVQKGLMQPLVCPLTRPAIMNQFDAQPEAIAGLFADPVPWLKAHQMNQVNIAVPTFFSNLGEDYLKTLLFAVGGKDAAVQPSGPTATDYSNKIASEVALIKALYTKLKTMPTATVTPSFMAQFFPNPSDQADLTAASSACLAGASQSPSFYTPAPPSEGGTVNNATNTGSSGGSSSTSPGPTPTTVLPGNP